MEIYIRTQFEGRFRHEIINSSFVSIQMYIAPMKIVTQGNRNPDGKQSWSMLQDDRNKKHSLQSSAEISAEIKLLSILNVFQSLLS